MLQKVFAVFLALFFLPGCVSSSAPISSGAFGGPLSTESSQSFTESRVAEGTVEDASMNSLLICTDDGERLRFSTENAQMDLGKSGLLLGQRVEVTYLPAQQDAAAAISVRLLSEENSLGDEQLKNILCSMTLEEKVAQMFWVRCPEQGAVQAVSDWQIGGFILFGRDFAEKTPETFRQVVDEYQKNAKIPLLIGTDEEGGEVVRASRYRQFRASAFPSPQQLYAQGGMESILSDAADKSAFLLDLGINVNLAPVCDLSINPADYIYSRTLGKDAQTTASYVAAVVQQMQQSGIGSVLKHFPGYGSNGDTHLGFVRDDRPLETFRNEDWIPFQSGIAAGAPSVLVSHTIVSCMDDSLPASLSPAVHRLLRDEWGFDGIIMTDDLSMSAICTQYGLEEAAILAVQAGNDLLISSDFEVQSPAILQAVQQGAISPLQIDSSVMRILRWKQDLGLFPEGWEST